MNHYQVQKELSSLIGRKVSFRRIAGNTIILYFGGEPGDDSVTTLSIDPSWRYANDGKWILGSGEIPWETEDENSSRFNAICDLCKPLVYSVVKVVTLSSDSSDIEIIFSGNQKLCSFASYTDDDNWTYNNRQKKKNIYGSLAGYEEKNT